MTCQISAIYFQITQPTGHQMNWHVLVSISRVRKQHVPDVNPLLFDDEPIGSPPIIALQIITLGRYGNLEYQLICYNCHYSTLDLHTSHSFCAFEETQESEVIKWWYKRFVVTYKNHLPPFKHQSIQGSPSTYIGPNVILCNFCQIKP